MNTAIRWILRTTTFIGMGLFLSLWWLSFAHGVDFVDGWREGDRYFVGEGHQRLQVAPWVYWYHQTLKPWTLITWLSAAVAGLVLHKTGGDTLFFRYLEGLIGGTLAAGVLAFAIGQVRHGVPLTRHLALLVCSILAGLAVARIRNQSAASGDVSSSSGVVSGSTHAGEQ